MYGKAYLIGCGPGDSELMTLKALNTIKKPDVVLIDNLVSKEIVELLPKRTIKIFTGKSKGKLLFSQNGINEALFAYAQSGVNVGRLKAGDPFVFGRGAEEADYLIQKGVEVQIIQGLSSALSAPFCAGIPVTFRGVSSSFSVVTAHLKDNLTNVDWLELLKIKNHTVVVLMGATKLLEIKQNALLCGVCPKTPVAIVSNASMSTQNVNIGVLEDLDQMQAVSPSVIIFGETVALDVKIPQYICSVLKERR